MEMNNSYADNLTENNLSDRASGKSKLWRRLGIVVVVAVVATVGFFGWQIWQRGKNQISLVKSANESYADDVRYISFGANYVFAIAKSYNLDDTSIAGAQLLIPGGIDTSKTDSYDKLFDAAGVAVQPLSQVKPKDGRGLKKYIKETLLPDLEKNVSTDVKVSYAYNGKYLGATIVVNKDGRQVRQEYAYSGPQPYLAIAQTKSDALVEVITTLIGVEDSTAKDGINQAKQVLQSDMALVQAGKIQELYDSAATEFKQKTSFNDLKSAVDNSSSYVSRNIVIPGGSTLASQFVGTLSFPPVAKDEKTAVSSIILFKVDGQWKLAGLSLPSASKKK
jgi:hypothetical protein